MGACDAKRTKLDIVEVEMINTGDPTRVHASCEGDSSNNKWQKSDNPMEEVATSSTEDSVYPEMNIDPILKREWADYEKGKQNQIDEYACDDVSFQSR